MSDNSQPFGRSVVWPRFTEKTRNSVNQVFDRGRFAVSGYWTGEPSSNEKLAEAFSSWNGSGYCVPVMNASMGILAALEALDIGWGDEVLVPALTWVSTATAVLNVNALPVLVDIDPDTYCIDTSEIPKALTSKTKAVIPVHLYGCMADMDQVAALSGEHGLKVIEDCAQSHGSIWRGRRSGSMGDLGVFSFEQSKVLSSGEGGCVVTDDPVLYRRVYQAAVDARLPNPKARDRGDFSLMENGELQGSNFKLTEFQAAVALEQLVDLDRLNLLREENARYLDSCLSGTGGYRLMKRHAGVDRQSFFSWCLRIDPEYFNCKSPDSLLLVREKLLRLLRQETGLPPYFVHSSYPPVNKNRMFCPWTKRRFPPELSRSEEFWRSQTFPNAERAVRESLVFHHAVLLEPKVHLDRIVVLLKDFASRKGGKMS